MLAHASDFIPLVQMSIFGVRRALQNQLLRSQLGRSEMLKQMRNRQDCQTLGTEDFKHMMIFNGFVSLEKNKKEAIVQAPKRSMILNA